MKITFVIAALTLLLSACSETATNSFITDPVELVNPLMGSDSDFSLSNGNTYPAIARPWGMNFWAPQTNKMGNGWLYQYDANKLRGFKQTHQPSPWINDYGQFSVFATTGKPVFSEVDRASWFSHKAETVKPYLYEVYLADYDVETAFTATERAAFFQFTFPESDSSNIIIDAFDGGSYIKIIPEENKVTGYTTKNSGGVPANFKNWFVVQFDKPFETFFTTDNESFFEGKAELKDLHTGAILHFNTNRKEKISIKIASSFISLKQAELNLKQEIADKTFDQLVAEGKSEWNRELEKIKIQTPNIDKARTFYSTLYRILLFPRKFFEVNAAGKIVHYSPYNGEVLPGYMFTDNGFWDTFRAVFPFFTLMYPDLNSQIMDGLVNAYKESGWLPEWASPGHRDCMIGSNSASLIADSYLKGIRGYDIETLYEAILKNTKGKGPVSSVGRYGAEYYNELGYIPYDVDIRENTARTLEYAYADYCIAELGKALGKPEEEISLFEKRAQNYRNVFDPETKLMRGKNENGEFQSPFNPYKWGDAFTEGNSWHYTWSVFHDVEGLARHMGGHNSFTTMLDSIFVVPPVFDCSYYGFPIHEIREMQIVNMGNYAHGNQPIQHMIYLYNYAGQPWKTQQHARQVLTKLYQPTPDGYCGDEDNGQTSAWYVFSALGFYPVCPGTPEYVIGSPLFEKVQIELPNGKQLTIEAEGAETNFYIQKAEFLGQDLNKSYFTHGELLKGGLIRFKMGSAPNKALWNAAESFPSSVTPPKK
ncbi:alpha-1,2-mannosidase, putative [Mariniphaga anaerophila]|uniref:Alpha-1,2-mannosidase, putative n=1 Tax=Mariniphaga anaerophila TaxID=1484053 RepID=A0A1M4TAF4_9BACT|nr:GH92 family glycosyl hydrolase [Mariniphaga anaerophila]SHE41405.1 alpha-1,2-mannosidase, putative [Mariniphaga anaerophila]